MLKLGLKAAVSSQQRRIKSRMFSSPFIAPMSGRNGGPSTFSSLSMISDENEQMTHFQSKRLATTVFINSIKIILLDCVEFHMGYNWVINE